MKTININLLGSSLSANSIYSSKKEDNVGESVKTLFKLMVISSSVLFVGCLGFWAYNINQMNGLNSKIEKIKTESAGLETQYKQLDSYGKSLVQEREDLEQKLKYKDIIDESFLPWSKILSDLTRAIPRNVVIDEIKKVEKNSVETGLKANYLSLKGRINTGRSPLQSLTFFLLNLNENYNKNTTLYNANAGNIKYDEIENTYSFEAETEIKLPNLQKPQSKVGG